MMIRFLPNNNTTIDERTDAVNILYSLLSYYRCENIAINEFYKQSSKNKPYLAITFNYSSTATNLVNLESTLSILLPSFKVHKRENQYLIYGDEGAVHFFLRYFLIKTLTFIQKECPTLSATDTDQPSSIKFLYDICYEKADREGIFMQRPKMVGCFLEDFFNSNILPLSEDTEGQEAVDTLSSLGVTLLTYPAVRINKASYLTEDNCGILMDPDQSRQTYNLFYVKNFALFFEEAILPSILRTIILRNNSTILLGLHSRCGNRSDLSKATKSSAFDKQIFRLVLKLAAPISPESLVIPPSKCSIRLQYKAASNSDEEEITTHINLVYKNMISLKEEKPVTQSQEEVEAKIAQDTSSFTLSSKERDLIRDFQIDMSPGKGGISLKTYQTFHNNVKLQNALSMLIKVYVTSSDFYTHITSVSFHKLCEHKDLVVAIAMAYDYWRSANFHRYDTPGFFSSHGRHGRNVTIAFVRNLMKVVNENPSPRELSALIDACTKEWYRTSDPDKAGSRAAFAKSHKLFKDDNHQKLGLAATITSFRHGFCSVPSSKDKKPLKKSRVQDKQRKR